MDFKSTKILSVNGLALALSSCLPSLLLLAYPNIGFGSDCVTFGTRLQSLEQRIGRINTRQCGSSSSASCTTCSDRLNKMQQEFVGTENSNGGVIHNAALRDSRICQNGQLAVENARQQAPNAQTGFFDGIFSASSRSSSAQRERQMVSSQLNGNFRTCLNEIDRNCALGNLNGANDAAMLGARENFLRACQEGERLTKTEAVNQGSSASSLGDLAKNTSDLAKLMTAGAQLAQVLGNRGGSNGGEIPGGNSAASFPNSSGVQGPTEPASTKLSGSPNGANTLTIRPPAPAAASVPSVAPAGVGGGGLENYDSSRIASKRDGAFKGGAGTEGGGPVGKGGAEGGHPPGADSRGGNGDGQGGDNSRSPASGKGESGTYDYGAGGVSARAGMMGIKPGGGELAELGSNPAATGETPKLDSLDQLSGSDASSGGSGSSMDPGSHPESIFVQVHGRYSALVKNGRF